MTIAVPVKDRRERMLRCLESLVRQDHPSFEVLVLDNGSTDGTGEACRGPAGTPRSRCGGAVPDAQGLARRVRPRRRRPPRRDLAVVGAAAALRSRPAVLLCLPYLWHRRPRTLHPKDWLLQLPQAVVLDLAVELGMVRGSLRHRRSCSERGARKELAAGGRITSP